MSISQERRRYLRLKATIPVELVDRSGTVLGVSETINLSRRGMLIRTPESPPLAKGDDVYVTIDLPTRDSWSEDEDSIEHFCFHAQVSRIGEGTVALHLKFAQLLFTADGD
jgi:hypothetical protein